MPDQTLRVDLSPLLGPLLARAYAQKGHHSVRAIFAEMRRDLRVWAEADSIANDGITLQAVDLAEYLIEFRGVPQDLISPDLIFESMAIYRAHLRAQGTSKSNEPHEGDSRLKARCKRGHPRTPGNVTAGGSCRDCGREYAKNYSRQRRAEKRREGRV